MSKGRKRNGSVLSEAVTTHDIMACVLNHANELVRMGVKRDRGRSRTLHIILKNDFRRGADKLQRAEKASKC